MALPPSATNQAFLREVDEELRREQVINAGKRWGGLAAVLVLAALLAFGGWIWWRHHLDARHGEAGEQLQTALDGLEGSAPPAPVATLAQLADSDSPGYRSMARFTLADQKLKAKDLKGAAALFAAVAADEHAAPAFRNLALVRQTAAEFDALPPATVVGRLRGLAVRGHPYFGSAGELVGIAYLRMDRPGIANALFGQIAADETVPDTIRQRAVQMAGVLSAAGAASAAIPASTQGNPTK